MVRWLSDLPRRTARRLRRRLEPIVLGRRGLTRIAIGRRHAGGVLDGVEIGDDGLVVVVGWAPDAAAFAAPLRLARDAEVLTPAHTFRVPRPDLAPLAGAHPERLGLVAEFVVPWGWHGTAVTLRLNDESLASITLPGTGPPEYHQLYGDPGVWTREHVYNVGAPVTRVSREILELADDLPGPLLDFGCGAGALLTALRSPRLEARGLELDTPSMRAAALPEAADRITYYDGAFPAPFADGAFSTVTCCEVLEHIPHPHAAVAEMARLARERLLLTVPDMSAIPRGFRHGVVPWHLMERSHINFFTQASLDAVLRPHFSRIEWFRIGEVRCDRLRFYTSLVARCLK